MKRLNRKISLLTALLLVMALVFTACSETDVSGYKLAAAYTSLDFETSGGRLRFQPVGEYLAGAFMFEKI